MTAMIMMDVDATKTACLTDGRTDGRSILRRSKVDLVTKRRYPEIALSVPSSVRSSSRISCTRSDLPSSGEAALARSLASPNCRPRDEMPLRVRR